MKGIWSRKGICLRNTRRWALKPVITKQQAINRISADDIERLFYPVIDTHKTSPEQLKNAHLGSGINAVPGAAAGKVVFAAAEAEKMAHKGDKVILVRKETSPEDVGGMHAAKGILTATGGKTSRGCRARGWGKCCIVGCEVLNINYETKSMTVSGKTIRQGDYITPRRFGRRDLYRRSAAEGTGTSGELLHDYEMGGRIPHDQRPHQRGHAI